MANGGLDGGAMMCGAQTAFGLMARGTIQKLDG